MAPRKTKARAAAVAKAETNGNEIDSKALKTSFALLGLDQPIPDEEIEEVDTKKTKPRGGSKKKAPKTVPLEENNDEIHVEENVLPEENNHGNDVDEKKGRSVSAAKKRKLQSAPVEENNGENLADEPKSGGASAKKRKSQQLTIPQIMNKEEKVEEPVPSEEIEVADKTETKTKPRRVGAKKQKAKETVASEEDNVENDVEEPVPSEESEVTDKTETKTKPRRGGAKKKKTEETVASEEDNVENDVEEPNPSIEKEIPEEKLVPSEESEVTDKAETKTKPRRGGAKKQKAKESVITEENDAENNVEEPNPSIEKEIPEEKTKSRGGGSRKRRAKEPVAAEENDDQDNMDVETPSVENENGVQEEETGKKASGKGKERARGKRAQSKSSDPDMPSSKQAKSSAKSSREKIPEVSNLNFDNESKSSRGKKWNFKISSWNVNGIRAWLEKNGQSFIKHEDPDIFCIQETKCSDDKIPSEIKEVKGYHCYWLSGDKEGYSGVGLMSKVKPKNVQYGIGAKDHDNEGRVITAEFDKFYVVNCYVPNSGRGLVRLDYRMQWDKDFRKYLTKLDEKKRVILCGDLNVSHKEIDLKNPKSNKKTAGFTQEERDGFTELLEEGFVDSFRYLYPDVTGAYTYWSYMFNARAKDVGWRLDYFVISKPMESDVCDCVIRKEVLGSDHCPLTLFLQCEM